MKKAIINGQNHKGSTWHIGNALAREISGEKNQRILKAMLDADLLIFITPNYCMMPSASMKAFLEVYSQLGFCNQE